MSERLQAVKNCVNAALERCYAPEKRMDHYIHLYGVAQAATALALRRGLDPEIAAAAGLLHDVYAYLAGSYDQHAQSGAEYARVALRHIGLFTEEERALITTAIFRHDDIEEVQGLYDEVLKDADILHPYLLSGAKGTHERSLPRVKMLTKELGFAAEPEVFPPKAKAERRAEIAETLAASRIRGDRSDDAYMKLIRYWPEPEAFSELYAGWCAAFVYHVVMASGTQLPIRHPKGTCRFAGVKAWLEWGWLEGFYHAEGDGFAPERGDIVIYDNILPPERKMGDAWHDHIGVVISASENELLVAEGNMDGLNVSGIIKRQRFEHIAGYVRIPETFEYR